jgi:hypothetical protein
LDANNGAGWDLAASLLRPREVVTDDSGGVKFLNTGRAPRLSAGAALKHSFIRQAGVQAAPADAAPASSSSSAGRTGSKGSGSKGSSSGKSSGKGSRGAAAAAAPRPVAAAKSGKRGGGLMGMWGALKNRVFDLEARVMQEATATEVQTGLVQKLRSDVAVGKAAPADLKREESALEDMQRSLESSVKEMNTVFTNAKGFLSAVLGPSKSKSKSGAKDSGRSSSSGSASGSSSSGQAAAPAKQLERRASKLEAREAAVQAAEARQAAAAEEEAEEEQRQEGQQAAKEAGVAAGAAVSGFLVRGRGLAWCVVPALPPFWPWCLLPSCWYCHSASASTSRSLSGNLCPLLLLPTCSDSPAARSQGWPALRPVWASRWRRMQRRRLLRRRHRRR